MARSRPFGVTLLAILVGIAAVVAGIHTLQMLHLWPISMGTVRFFTFDLIGAILWGVMFLIWLWVVRGLWNLDPSAWLFVVVLSSLNLILDALSILGGSTFAAMWPSLLINGLVLIYGLLPGTKAAFGQQ